MRKQKNTFRKLDRGSHSVSELTMHLVFVTKYRRKVFTTHVIRYLAWIFRNTCKKYGAKLIEFNGEDDHVHLLVRYVPKIPISKLVMYLKGNASREIRKRKYPSITAKLWGEHLWSPSYFAGSCGGATIAKLRQYIEKQRALECN